MANCDVCIGGWDGDAAEMYTEEMRTARKAHQCYECQREIKPGERYENVSGRWEGEFSNYKFCWLCSEVSKVFSCGEGRTFGILWEHMHEYAFPNLTTASPCFRELSASAKTGLLRRWQEWKGLRA